MNRQFRAYPYPSYWNRLAKATRFLPNAAAGMIRAIMEERGKDIPQKLKNLSGSTDQSTGALAKSTLDDLRKLKKNLPESKKKVELYKNLSDFLKRDARVLLQVETLLRLLTRKNVRREGIPDDNELQLKSILLQLNTYLLGHIELHSLLVENASSLQSMDEKKARKIEQLPSLLRDHTNAVLTRLAKDGGIKPPGSIQSVKQSPAEIRKDIQEVVKLLDITYAPFSE